MTLDIPDWLGALIAFLFGASVGSFVNVVAYRLPREISIVTPRSFCPECNRPIPWWANIPILAYLGLRGRCLMCGAPIAFRHFMAELSLAVSRRLPLPELSVAGRVRALRVLRRALHRRPDRLRLAIDSEHHNFSGHSDGTAGRDLHDSGSRARAIADRHRVGWGFLFLTGEVYFWLRSREGVGMGDVWLLGMVGAFMGWPGAVFTLFVGSILGSVGGLVSALSGGAPAAPVAENAAGAGETETSVLRTEVPFGPFLALAAGVFALFQPQIKRWYLGH